jgi:hypothetical protein
VSFVLDKLLRLGNKVILEYVAGGGTCLRSLRVYICSCNLRGVVAVEINLADALTMLSFFRGAYSKLETSCLLFSA